MDLLFARAIPGAQLPCGFLIRPFLPFQTLLRIDCMVSSQARMRYPGRPAVFVLLVGALYMFGPLDLQVFQHLLKLNLFSAETASGSSQLTLGSDCFSCSFFLFCTYALHQGFPSCVMEHTRVLL